MVRKSNKYIYIQNWGSERGSNGVERPPEIQYPKPGSTCGFRKAWLLKCSILRRFCIMINCEKMYLRFWAIVKMKKSKRYPLGFKFLALKRKRSYSLHVDIEGENFGQEDINIINVGINQTAPSKIQKKLKLSWNRNIRELHLLEITTTISCQALMIGNNYYAINRQA